MMYCYGYASPYICLPWSNNYALVSLRYIAVNLAEICSGKDERAQRFHANWVGVKNLKLHKRNSPSAEYKASVIQYPADPCVSFTTDLYQSIVTFAECTIAVPHLARFSIFVGRITFPLLRCFYRSTVDSLQVFLLFNNKRDVK